MSVHKPKFKNIPMETQRRLHGTHLLAPIRVAPARLPEFAPTRSPRRHDFAQRSHVHRHIGGKQSI
jgi:hypothetical protein